MIIHCNFIIVLKEMNAYSKILNKMNSNLYSNLIIWLSIEFSKKVDRSLNHKRQFQKVYKNLWKIFYNWKC